MVKLKKKNQKSDRLCNKTGLKQDAEASETFTKNYRLPSLPRIAEVLSPVEQQLLQEASDLNRFINTKIEEDDR
jgi:hypothetical protein